MPTATAESISRGSCRIVTGQSYCVERNFGIPKPSRLPRRPSRRQPPRPRPTRRLAMESPSRGPHSLASRVTAASSTSRVRMKTAETSSRPRESPGRTSSPEIKVSEATAKRYGLTQTTSLVRPLPLSIFFSSATDLVVAQVCSGEAPEVLLPRSPRPRRQSQQAP